MDSDYFVGEFGPLYVENKGRPGKPVRLLVALHYLKHTYNQSDESVVERFLENPYWQYFCGFEYFQHEFPLDPTSLVKWRNRIGSEGMEKLFYQTLKTAQSLGLHLSERLLAQKREDKHKLYSVHAPEVECIAKGKAHKRYEFGCKVSVATTSRHNWVVGIQALHGNPYDGHTLKGILEQVERLTNYQVKEACCDRGYRGHNYEGDATVHIVGQKQRGSPVTRSLRKWLRRRNAIEPKTGHLKEDNRMNRNYLKGTNGDRVNALLAGCGANLRKLMAAFFLPFLEIRRFLEKITNNFQRTIKTETPVLMNTV